jgi:hypothetical protein
LLQNAKSFQGPGAHVYGWIWKPPHGLHVSFQDASKLGRVFGEGGEAAVKTFATPLGGILDSLGVMILTASGVIRRIDGVTVFSYLIELDWRRRHPIVRDECE